MNCIICDNPTVERLKKGEIIYRQCCSCKTLFSDPLPNGNKVGGEYEQERNDKHNAVRLERLMKMTDGQKEGVRVLDFGCGNGIFVNYLNENGVYCEGYDKYHPKFSTLPKRGFFNIITMVEVAEHLSGDFQEFDIIRESLMRYGRLYLESSFVNVAEEENIPLEEFFYINPDAGHSTIFSFHGLDFLLFTKGFFPIEHTDRNTRNFYKL